MDPPDIDTIIKAIISLQENGAVTLAKKNYLDINLTFLGKLYSELPLDIKLSRLIVLG